MEIRMARLEGAYEQINERLGAIESQHQKFLWLIGLVLVSIILPLAQRYAGHT